MTLQRQADAVFAAAVAGAAVVAQADGRVDAAERAELLAWMGASRLLDGFDPEEVAVAFDRCVSQFEEEGGPEAVLAVLARVAGGRQARLVVEGAEVVALADGVVDAAEERAIGLIRRAVLPRESVSGLQ